MAGLFTAGHWRAAYRISINLQDKLSWLGHEKSMNTSVQKKLIKKQKVVLLGIAIIVLIASVPLFIDGLYGDDLLFHLWRIEAIKSGLEKHIFPVKIYDIFMGGKGYASGVYYPDLFLYIPAVLRLFGVSLQVSVKALYLIITIITTCNCYYVCKYISDRQEVAIIVSFVWTTCNYRLEDMYVRAAIGETIALAFFPLVIGGIYVMLYEIGENWYKKSIGWLVVGMTGIIESHILSVELVVILGTLILGIHIGMVNKKKILSILFSIISTLMINAGFLIPFATYMLSEKVLVNVKREKQIQSAGLSIRNFLNFFERSSGKKDLISEALHTKTLGYSLLAGLVLMLGYCVISKRKTSKRQLECITIVTIIMCWFCSRYFPYDFLCANSSLVNTLLGTIQFPWRWLGCVSISIVFGLLFILRDYKGKKITIYIVLMIITLLSVTEKQCLVLELYREPGRYESVEDLPDEPILQVMAGEYLPIEFYDGGYGYKSDAYNQPKQLLSYTYSANGCEAEVLNTSQRNEYISFPLIYYNGYKAYSESGMKLDVKADVNGYVSVCIPQSFTGSVGVRYVEKWYWRCAEIVSLVTVIIFIYLYYGKKRA